MLKNGKLVNAIIYYANGQILNETRLDDGKVISYKFYEDGSNSPSKNSTKMFYEISLDENLALKNYKFFDLQTKKRTYEGNCENNKKSGHGKEYDKDGNISYEGAWLNDQKHGEGFSYYKDGSIKTCGKYSRDKKHGFFKSYYENGNNKSEQNWVNGSITGDGKVSHTNGSLQMDGYFSENYFKGVFYGENGIKLYEGEMVKYIYSDNYIKDGKGDSFYENGITEYSGEWKLNKFEGSGKVFYIDSKLNYSGNFKDNLFNGMGAKYDYCGKLMCIGTWKSGMLESIKLKPEQLLKGYQSIDDGDEIYIGGVVNGEIEGYVEIHKKDSGLRFFEGFCNNDHSKKNLAKAYYDHESHHQVLQSICHRTGHNLHGYSFDYHQNGKFNCRLIFEHGKVNNNKFCVKYFSNGKIDFH